MSISKNLLSSLNIRAVTVFEQVNYANLLAKYISLGFCLFVKSDPDICLLLCLLWGNPKQTTLGVD